jgi:hypothetical protein
MINTTIPVAMSREREIGVELVDDVAGESSVAPIDRINHGMRVSSSPTMVWRRVQGTGRMARGPPVEGVGSDWLSDISG